MMQCRHVRRYKTGKIRVVNRHVRRPAAYSVFIEPELNEAVKKKRRRDYRTSKESGDEFIRSFNA